ncbi:MAG: transposase [bacterium]|nr:transposase [bacterium]
MLGINQVVTSRRSPWQNGYCERVIGSIRRECLDHIIVLNEKHLHRILKEYFGKRRLFMARFVWFPYLAANRLKFC